MGLKPRATSHVTRHPERRAGPVSGLRSASSSGPARSRRIPLAVTTLPNSPPASMSPNSPHNPRPRVPRPSFSRAAFAPSLRRVTACRGPRCAGFAQRVAAPRRASILVSPLPIRLDPAAAPVHVAAGFSRAGDSAFAFSPRFSGARFGRQRSAGSFSPERFSAEARFSGSGKRPLALRPSPSPVASNPPLLLACRCSVRKNGVEMETARTTGKALASFSERGQHQIQDANCAVLIAASVGRSTLLADPNRQIQELEGDLNA